MSVSSKKKLSQYERLAGMLRDRIAAGTYARGDKLPSEMELMDESGLSRSTVRHALKVLVDEGLVRTERGRGAFVADTPALHENNLVFSSYTKQVEGQGMKPTTRTVDSAFAKAAGSIAKFFDAAVGSKLVKLVRLRYLDDAPLCLETTYLPPSFETLIDRDINGSLYATLRQEFHRAPVFAQRRARAGADPDHRLRLRHRRPPAPCLQAHPTHRPRQIHRTHRLAHQTRQTVPNERFTCGFIKSQASMAQMPTSPGNTRRPSPTVPAQNIQYRKSK